MKVLDTFSKLLGSRVHGVEYVLLKIITNLYLIRSSFNDFYSDISLEVLEVNISSKIRDLVFSKEFNLKETLVDHDLSLSPDDPKENKDIIDFFYSVLINILEDVLSSKVDVVTAILSLESLKQEMIESSYRKKLSLTSELYATKNISMAIDGDRELQEEINGIQNVLICNEGDSGGSNDFIISSYEDSITVRVKNQTNMARPLFKIIGDGPLSEKFTVSSDDIVVIVAEINIGKTRFVYSLIHTALISGVNVTFVATEEGLTKIQAKLEKAHLFKMFNYTDYPESAILTKDSLEDLNLKHHYEVLESKMELVRRDLWGNKAYGKLHAVENFCFEDSREFFRAEKRVYNSDIIIIDHVRALSSNGKRVNGKYLSDQKEQLAHLASCARLSKVEDQLGFILATHPNASAETSFKSNKQNLSANLTASAREIAESATRIFTLTSSLHLEVNDQVYLTEAKTREEQKIRTPQVLARQGASNIHLWLPQIQEGETLEEITDITDI